MLEQNKQTWIDFLSGKEDAMLNLYREHYLGLMNFGTKISNNRTLANECITQMLIELWDSRDRLPVIDNIRAYLLTCLKRTIYHYYKKERMRLHKEGTTLQQSDELNVEDYLSRIQENGILRKKLVFVMEKLGPRQRELIHLRFFLDLDYDEIAIQCNITKRTAYNRVNEALNLMKEELQRDNGDFNSIFYLNLVLFAMFLADKSPKIPHL